MGTILSLPTTGVYDEAFSGIQRAGGRQKQCTYTKYLCGLHHLGRVWGVILAEWLSRRFCYRFQLFAFEAGSNPGALGALGGLGEGFLLGALLFSNYFCM